MPPNETHEAHRFINGPAGDGDWAEVGWFVRGVDYGNRLQPTVYMFDPSVGTPTYYDEFVLSPGIYYWFQQLFLSGTSWCNYVFYDNVWELLDCSNAGVGASPHVEARGETSTPTGTHWPVSGGFSNLQLARQENQGWQLWDTSFTTTQVYVVPSQDPYFVDMHQSYYWFNLGTR
jgi:hypothetical protein